MRGRYPSGPELIEQLEGSEKAKKRVRVILETMTNARRVQEACAELDVCEQRVRQLRAAMLQAAVTSVEDQPPGRPRQPQEPPEVAALREQVAELQRELQAARLRAEIAVALPHVTAPPAAPQKKRRTRKPRH
ncbi:MAG TPA: hypothetical protein VG013_39245 [Gemmataceae bacterium]|nr:hypothetical protein [Gemmataceae bacterium]